MDRGILFLVAVIGACFVTMIALNIHWTTSNTFVPSSTSVALYQSDTCAMSSYKIVVGSNETCISASSGNDTVVLFDNNTFIFSTSDPSRYLSFLIGGSPSTTTTLYTTQTVNRSLIAPDFDGTILVQQTGTGFVFIGQTAQDHGSNAGVQLSSLTANRAQYRANQYGANSAGPGVTGFKSRSSTIGVSQSVLVGDLLWRTTAIGVAGDDSTIPLAATISIIASAVGSNYVGTSYELALVDDEGIVNGRRPVFAVNSHGWPRWLESSSTNPQPAPKTPPSDVVVLGAGGTITIPCHVIPANARIQLTIQPGQAPVGIVWVSAIVASTSFTISSTSASDAGVSVYYMISIPL